MVQATLRVTTAAFVLWAAGIAPVNAQDNGDTHYTVDCQSSAVNFTLSARRVLVRVHRQGQFREFTGDICTTLRTRRPRRSTSRCIRTA